LLASERTLTRRIDRTHSLMPKSCVSYCRVGSNTSKLLVLIIRSFTRGSICKYVVYVCVQSRGKTGGKVSLSSWVEGYLRFLLFFFVLFFFFFVRLFSTSATTSGNKRVPKRGITESPICQGGWGGWLGGGNGIMKEIPTFLPAFPGSIS
jgi:hypothetical protein